VFVVEKISKFQDAFRESLKKKGYRVLVATDPALAYERFLQIPYDALILNASTIGEDGRYKFEQIMRDAELQGTVCAGILILSQEQESWVEEIPPFPCTAVMVQPVTLPKVLKKLAELEAQAAQVTSNQ
jgi:DNA-binding response OmpR family regulator